MQIVQINNEPLDLEEMERKVDLIRDEIISAVEVLLNKSPLYWWRKNSLSENEDLALSGLEGYGTTGTCDGVQFYYHLMRQRGSYTSINSLKKLKGRLLKVLERIKKQKQREKKAGFRL